MIDKERRYPAAIFEIALVYISRMKPLLALAIAGLRRQLAQLIVP